MTMPMGATGSVAGNKMTGGYNPSFNVGKSKGGYRPAQLQQFSPEQMQLFQSLFGHLQPGSYLSRLAGGDEDLFEEIEAPAKKQLGEFQGQLASRFSGLGTGARRSSGHSLAQGQLATDFAQQLQSQRQGLQRQAIGDLMGLSNQLLGQRPYDQSLIKKDMSFWKQLLLGVNEAGQEFAGGLGQAAGKAWF